MNTAPLKITNSKRYNPLRAAIQMAVARCIVRPFHYFYFRNHFSIIGLENVPQSGPFLAVSNHLSVQDPSFVVVCVGRSMGFIAKKELFQIPWLSPIIRLLGAIEINREKPSVSSIRSIKQAFAAGWSVGIFIEGTRNKTPGVLGQPHTGAAYFAWSNKVKILPVGLINTDQRGGKAIIHIGKLIEPTGDLDFTTWEIMEAISQLTGFKLPEHRLIQNK
jgi:1-acyl-sn-glycerol-3-phosphate acyltransferase